MPLANIAGRGPEIKKLRKALDSDLPELIAIYGRRRVGKTYLVREFFDDKICFELTGIHKATLREQLENYASALSEATNSLIPLRSPGTWQEAFAQSKASWSPVERAKCKKASVQSVVV